MPVVHVRPDQGVPRGARGREADAGARARARQGRRGNRNKAKEEKQVKVPKLPNVTSLKDFELGRILGTGSFGRVLHCKHKATGMHVAIKILSKAQILKTKQVNHIIAEKDILKSVQNPFVVNLLAYFMDELSLYLVMEFIVGGEFFTHLRLCGRFPEETARFYSAQIVLAFEYLHSMNVVYRDLKPENLLIDGDGNVKITDFGFAKVIESRTYKLCGTPDYLAPEIILNKGHGKPVDWWALGVLIFEMLSGFPPFYDDDPMGTYQKILHGKIDFPSHFSRSARDLVKKLLQADLTKRYGNLRSGAKDIKSHPWFAGLDWNALQRKVIAAPIKPPVTGTGDTSQYDYYSDVGPLVHDFDLTEEDQQNFKPFGL